MLPNFDIDPGRLELPAQEPDKAGMMQISLERLESAVAAMRSDLSGRPADERRLLPRYRVWAPAMVIPCDASGAKAGPSFEVWVLDLSRGGLGFMSSRPLKLGQCFRFTLPSADAATPPQHTISQVVYCSPAAAGSHTVGAKFVAELPATRGGNGTIPA